MPPPERPFQFRRRAPGFSLVEVTFALGIAAFCLVLLLGLLPTGLNTIQAGTEETAALNRLSAVLADVRAAPSTAVQTSRYAIRFDGKDTTGNPITGVSEFQIDETGILTTASGSGPARYRIGWKIPPSTPNQNTQCARVYLRASWPAGALAARAQGMVEVAVSVNRNP